MPQFNTPIQTFRGPGPSRDIQSSSSNFIAAPPNHSTLADSLAQEIGGALGTIATRRADPEREALAQKAKQETASAQAKAAADKQISTLVASHVAAKRSLGEAPNLQEIKDEIIPVAQAGGYKPGDLAETVLNLVANYGDQSDPNYDKQVTAAGVPKFGPLGKENAYSTGRQDTLIKQDTEAKAADRVAVEEHADARNNATNNTSRANNADTINAENQRAANTLAAQTAKEEMENTRKTREGYKDPKVLGDLIDQALGTTPAGKSPASTDTSIDPMQRASILARASELVEAGQTRENAVVQAIKEKGTITPAKSGFFGSTPPKFNPIADAAAAQTGTGKPAPAGPQKLTFNPKTGKIE